MAVASRFSLRPRGLADLTRWQVLFLFFVGTLSSTILLKFGQIQYLELLYFAEIFVLLLIFEEKRYTVTWFKPFLRLALGYLLLSLGAILLSVAALRFDFYFPEDVGFLQRPIIITLARLVELAASVVAMLYLAHLFRRNAAALRFTCRIYFWTGVASVFYSFLSYPFARAGIYVFGVYSEGYRFRGFYNEGGPYGLYLISVLLVGLVLFYERWEAPRRLALMLGPFLGCFFMAQSKAALSAIATMVLLNVVLARGFRNRTITVVLGAVVFYSGSQLINLPALFRSYQQASATYERLSHLHPDDINYVYGRVAAAFFVPRMIAQHPLSGVGWGNYSLLRNAPEYRGASAWAKHYDLPGIGLFSYAAELGLPLFALLYGCLLLPYIYLRRLRVPYYVANLALLQPIVHTFGAQLNVTYPWITTAFALGIAYSVAPSSPPLVTPSPEPPLEISREVASPSLALPPPGAVLPSAAN